MENNMFIAPAQGLTVRDPLTGVALAAEGEYKPRNTYWIRRFKDGDVVTATPPADTQPSRKDKVTK